MTAPHRAAAPHFPPIHPEALPMPPTTAPTRPQTPARTNGARHSVVAPIPFPDPSELTRQRAERAHAEQLRDAMRLANAERHAPPPCAPPPRPAARRATRPATSTAGTGA